MVTNTVSGGVVFWKNSKLDRKAFCRLPASTKTWTNTALPFRDYGPAGRPITNHMMAGNPGFLGDGRLSVDRQRAKFQETGSQQTRFIAVTRL